QWTPMPTSMRQRWRRFWAPNPTVYPTTPLKRPAGRLGPTTQFLCRIRETDDAAFFFRPTAEVSDDLPRVAVGRADLCGGLLPGHGAAIPADADDHPAVDRHLQG